MRSGMCVEAAPYLVLGVRLRQERVSVGGGLRVRRVHERAQRRAAQRPQQHVHAPQVVALLHTTTRTHVSEHIAITIEVATLPSHRVLIEDSCKVTALRVCLLWISRHSIALTTDKTSSLRHSYTNNCIIVLYFECFHRLQ